MAESHHGLSDAERGGFRPGWLSQPYTWDRCFLLGSIHEGPGSKPRAGYGSWGLEVGGCSGDVGLEQRLSFVVSSLMGGVFIGIIQLTLLVLKM